MNKKIIFYYLRCWPRILVIELIRIYQKTLSPDHGPLRNLHPHGFCRFHPTCSQYGLEAISKYGIFKGGLLAAYRVVRCNPWTKGGIDELK